MLRRFMACASLAVGLALGLGSHALAQQYTQVGDYEIHYSAVNTSFLTPEVAQANNIQRSQGIALLNVSVLETQPDGSSRPVSASVQGSVSGLTDTPRNLAFRTVHDGDSTYQLATFRIQEDEPMRFDLDVRYDRNQAPAEVSFIQRFYLDR
ncbi:DUF4426 domain-containing protein [Halomonas sp. ZH2S]|uniref:DUF4426 domain-containing protein n=1 Tax=Vreelandella zhuhanensis TaxID=2684210 RepID=A0A7X3KQZ6_9GAMM|nr:DUF4426 domain-containing protein [Halomonas zhuhanensis]MWJ27811.1 DUF4426 domain-containing protein [Halomonas zhuhanensis]